MTAEVKMTAIEVDVQESKSIVGALGKSSVGVSRMSGTSGSRRSRDNSRSRNDGSSFRDSGRNHSRLDRGRMRSRDRSSSRNRSRRSRSSSIGRRRGSNVGSTRRTPVRDRSRNQRTPERFRNKQRHSPRRGSSRSIDTVVENGRIRNGKTDSSTRPSRWKDSDCDARVDYKRSVTRSHRERSVGAPKANTSRVNERRPSKSSSRNITASESSAGKWKKDVSNGAAAVGSTPTINNTEENANSKQNSDLMTKKMLSTSKNSLVPNKTTKNKSDEEDWESASADDSFDETIDVDKWVRSAPAELYYVRQEDGEFLGTVRTKELCDKFEKKLVQKAKTARLEAERLGLEKHIELTEQDRLEAQKQKDLKRLKKLKKLSCCSKVNPDTSDGDKSKETCPGPAIGSCKHEEGEICDSDEEAKKTSCQAKQDSCVDLGEKPSATCGSKSSAKTTCKKEVHRSSSSSSDSYSSSDSDSSDDECGDGLSRNDAANRELEKKKQHPCRLHTELWHNDPGLMNDGPVCRCSAKARRFGIRHGFYPGEESIPFCDPFRNNQSRLHHYRITISPPTNFLVKTPTVIKHDSHEYIFEGFSLFSHDKVDLSLPPCKVIRFNILYDVFIAEEKFPESFCIKELQLFETYLFREVLELLDLKYDWNEEGSCAPFHLMPRFVRQLPDNGKEILSMNRVLIHLLKSDKEIIKEDELMNFLMVPKEEWQKFADKHKGMIVTKFGSKPCAIRVDQIDRDVSVPETDKQDGIPYPDIVHFGIRPPQLSYAGNADYQKAWRRYVKYRHLLSNMAKPSAEEKRNLVNKELQLQKMRTDSRMKRDVTVEVSSKGFRATGIFCDLVQHAMLIPVLTAHLRFHKSLSTLETRMGYVFKHRYLLQLAMTHPSYRENFGTNPDHARNALTNCGIRQPEYGDRRIHYASIRKRGINTLINIMAKFGSDKEMESEITHNERLEFLGDAVVEFVSSIHLFHIFPDLEEGGLATYRAAIVQNQHLAVLAQTLTLDQYMLYAHGSDLCHDSELRHAMANCFEALMGALFLDGEINVADRVFGKTLFGADTMLYNLWTDYPKHPLQQEEPEGDRHWIESHNVLQKLSEFEERMGITFTHVRLLARAFTDRSLGYNNLSRGSNQRLEFLGDTVLQLISSEYLYRHFPDHHEGHLSLLRSSLVNNRTQALVCDDLGMTEFAMRGDPKSEMKTKDRADLLEAFLGALYVDKNLDYCFTFCSVCFFPRLNKSIIKQEWNDPKSKLQQCCLTLREMDGKEPDIPVYKVTKSLGPTNTRVYEVAVHFRKHRLATAQGHSIQEAEMNAAQVALRTQHRLFPQLNHQKSIMDKTSKRFRFR